MAKRRYVAPARGAVAPGVFDHPVFAGFAAHRAWLDGVAWPPLETLDAALAAAGAPECFIAQDAALLSDGEHYELRIARRGHIATRPDVLREIGRLMAQHARELKADRIAGAELGGVPLAAAASLAAELPFVLIRNQKKEYGTAKQMEGDLKDGERVLLVEDVLTTGGQVLEAARTLADAGAKVVRIVAVIDRMEGARQNIEQAGYEMAALVTTKDLGLTS